MRFADTPKEISRQPVPLQPQSLELMPYNGESQQYFTAQSNAVIINDLQIQHDFDGKWWKLMFSRCWLLYFSSPHAYLKKI